MKSLPLNVVRYMEKNEEQLDKTFKHKNLNSGVVFFKCPKLEVVFSMSDYNYWKKYKDVYSSKLYEAMSEEEA